MNDETITPAEDAETTPSQPDSSAATEKTGSQDKETGREGYIPRDRFDEVYRQAQETQRQLDKLLKVESERQEAEKLARGEHEDVIAELRPKAELADRLLAEAEASLKDELDKVPENLRVLVPEGDALAQLAWIRNAREAGVFKPPTPPDTDAGKTGDRQEKLELTPAQRQMARNFGYTDQQFAAGLANNVFLEEDGEGGRDTTNYLEEDGEN